MYINLFNTFTAGLLWAFIMAAAMLPRATAADEHVFLVKPSETETLVGDDALMECQLDKLGDLPLYWFVNNSVAHPFLIGPFENVNSQLPRYEIMGNVSIGEYNLQISGVTLRDSGDYGCLVVLTNGSSDVQIAQLTVIAPVPPVDGGPVCDLIGSTEEREEGDPVSMNCTSMGGKPPAGLAWKRDRTDISGEYISYDDDQPGEGYNAVNWYNWTLAPEDDQATYTCYESHDALDESRKCQVGPFSVKYKPIVSVTPEKLEAEIGDDVTFRCSAAANPEVTVPFVWHFNGSQVNESDMSVMMSNDTQVESLTIFNITEVYYGLQVICGAVNDLGMGNATGVIVRIKEVPPARDTTNVMLIIAVIVAITLVTVIITVIGMHAASSGVSCACCGGDATKKNEERKRAEESKNKKQRNQNVVAVNHRDDLGIDLRQFEGGSNQNTQSLEMNEVTVDFQPPATTPPPPDFIPPPPGEVTTRGYNNPTFTRETEKPNGMNDLQHGNAIPNNIDIISEDENRDSTSHDMKMARKKKRESQQRKQKQNNSGHDPERLSDDPEKWVL